jgi:two-component system cell cycle sensor histidine kinase/response regulator CckA
MSETTRKKRSDLLDLLEDRMMHILDASNQGFWLVDNNDITVYMNPQLCRILRYRKKDVIGKSIYKFVDRINRDIFCRQGELRKRGRKSSYEIELRRTDGTIIPCLFHAAPFNDNTGKKIGAFAMVTDLSAQKKTETALRLSEERYRGLVQNAPIGILHTDIEGNILEVNDSLVKILGSPSARATMAINVFRYAPLRNAGISEVFRRCLRSGKPISGKHPYKSKWDKKVYLQYHLNPVKDHDGEISGIIASVIDMTPDITAKETLRATHEIYRDAIVNSQGVPYRLNYSTGKYEFFGEGLQEILGYPANKLTYEKIDKITKEVLITDPRYANDPAGYGRALREGRIKRSKMDIRVRNATGEYRWLNDCSVPIRDEKTQRIIGSLGIMQDITDRKKIENQLKDSEARYRTLFQSANDAIFLMKGDKFVHCNVKTTQMFGCRYEDIINTPPYEFSPRYQPDGRSSRAKAREKIKAALNGEPQFFEWLHSRLDNTLFYAEVSLNKVIISEKPFLLAVVRDITQRKEAEKILRASEARYRTLFEQASNAIFLETDDHQILDANRAASDLFGFSHQEFVTLKTTRLYQKFNFDEIFTKNHMNPVEINAVHKTGKQLAVDITIAPLRTDNGTLYLSMLRDISEKKLLERQLHQSQKMEAIGRLAGGVAHDFNNLLTVIRGYSELIQLQVDADTPTFNRIKQIDHACDRAESLTRQLLAFSRRQILQPKIINLNDLIRDMEKMFSRIIGEDVELKTHLNSRLGRIETDPGQIEQVILNLVVNARDAMPAGGIILIETDNVTLDRTARRKHPEIREGKFIRLSITDSGIGIDRETQAHIFEPFFTTKKEGEGTGLGLATVYGIVKQSNGFIWVYSEPNQGTTFKVYLPRCESEVPGEVADAAMQMNLIGNETVLVVEDEIDVRQLVCETLEMMNYKVIEASNGPEALEVMRNEQNKIQLVLTDVVMPQMSGKEMADKIKKLKPDMEVLYMSGYTENAIVHKGVLEAGTNFIQKPFTPAALIKKVREVLDKTRIHLQKS